MSKKKPKAAVRRKRAPARNSGVKLSATVLRHSSVKGGLKYVPWNTVELEELNPLLQRQLVVGQDIMLARVLLKKGCIVPEHSHPNEQLTFILEGALKFWVDGKEIVVRSGETLAIPRNMPHKAEALEDTVDFDIFNPPRADWINKTDQYLRKR